MPAEPPAALGVCCSRASGVKLGSCAALLIVLDERFAFERVTDKVDARSRTGPAIACHVRPRTPRSADA
jgi:hypothetical protein